MSRAPEALPFLLTIGALPVFAVAFVLFRRALRDLSEREQQRFQTEGLLPAWRRGLGVVPIAIMFLVENTTIQVAAAIWAVVQLCADAWQTNALLERRGFSPELRVGMLRVAAVGALGTVVLAAGVVLSGVQARGWSG